MTKGTIRLVVILLASLLVGMLGTELLNHFVPELHASLVSALERSFPQLAPSEAAQ